MLGLHFPASSQKEPRLRAAQCNAQRASQVDGASAESSSCKSIDTKMPAGISLLLRKQKWTAKASPKPLGLLQQDPAPEDQLAKEMSHDLEMNFNKIAPSLLSRLQRI